jgi:hypothetical protein
MLTNTKRLKTKSLIIIAVSALLFIGMLVFTVSWSDPIINYYGVELRRSQLDAFIQAKADPDAALYCQQMAAFSIGATFTCFDTQAELDYFATRRSHIQAELQ